MNETGQLAAKLLGARRRAAPDRERSVVFMHMPKTAGTAVAQGLKAALSPAATAEGFDRMLFGAFDGWDAVEPEARRQVFMSPAAMPSDVPLVAGHFAWSTLREAYPDGRFMTIGREPVARLLSHWVYWRQVPDAPMRPWGGWKAYVDKARSSLEAFLDDPAIAPHTDNMMTRFLLWPDARVPVSGFIAPGDDRRLLRLAQKRLRGFDFIDVVENDALERRLAGWLERPFRLLRVNETASMPLDLRCNMHRELTPRAYELIEARSRLDLRLWEDIARRRLPGMDLGRLRQRTIISAVSRYAAMMAPASSLDAE